MEFIIVGLGSLLLWSIARPGWVYESRGCESREKSPSPEEQVESKLCELGETNTDCADVSDDFSSIRRTTPISTEMFTEEEQAEAARSLRGAAMNAACLRTLGKS